MPKICRQQCRTADCSASTIFSLPHSLYLFRSRCFFSLSFLLSLWLFSLSLTLTGTKTTETFSESQRTIGPILSHPRLADQITSTSIGCGCYGIRWSRFCAYKRQRSTVVSRRTRGCSVSFCDLARRRAIISLILARTRLCRVYWRLRSRVAPPAPARTKHCYFLCSTLCLPSRGRCACVTTSCLWHHACAAAAAAHPRPQRARLCCWLLFAASLSDGAVPRAGALSSTAIDLVPLRHR